LKPMAIGNRILHISPWRLPAGTRHFIPEAKITGLHDVVHTHPLIAIIVIVTLPHGAIAIHCHLIGISEVMTKDFHVLKIRITPDNATFLIAAGIHHIARAFTNMVPMFMSQPLTIVTKIKVERPVWAKQHCRSTTILLIPFYTLEDDLH